MGDHLMTRQSGSEREPPCSKLQALPSTSTEPTRDPSSSAGSFWIRSRIWDCEISHAMSALVTPTGSGKLTCCRGEGSLRRQLCQEGNFARPQAKTGTQPAGDWDPAFLNPEGCGSCRICERFCLQAGRVGQAQGRQGHVAGVSRGMRHEQATSISSSVSRQL